MQLLHIDSSVLGAASISRLLSSEIAKRLHELHPELQIVYRNLGTNPIPHLIGSAAAALRIASTEQSFEIDLLQDHAYLNEVLDSDLIVIGAPMYNLTISTQLKTWVDRIAVKGKTFRYTPKGPEGFLRSKKVYIASSRGGVYSKGSPMAALDHQESYLTHLFGFLVFKTLKSSEPKASRWAQRLALRQ